MQGGLIKITDANGKVQVESFKVRQRRLSKAFQAYARKHNLYTDTVRTVTKYRNAAMVEAGIV